MIRGGRRHELGTVRITPPRDAVVPRGLVIKSSSGFTGIITGWDANTMIATFRRVRWYDRARWWIRAKIRALLWWRR